MTCFSIVLISFFLLARKDDNAVPAIPLTTPPADLDPATELPPKKKIKREYEGEKTKNSKPNNPRGGIADIR